MTVRISVIVPTYNRCDFLAESIQSALAQSLTPHEIIIVDDGSSDDTQAVAASFGARVSYLRQENKGKSAALNTGIAAATGQFLLVLDDDDLLAPRALAAHADAMARSPNAKFSFGRFVRFRGEGHLAHLSKDVEVLPCTTNRRLVVQLMDTCFLPNPSWLVHRETQLAIGPYRTDLPRGQDYEMILRLARSHPGVFAKATTFYQRKHVSQRHNGRGSIMTEDTVEGWIEAEKHIFREIDDGWTNDDFRPWDGMPSGDETERTILLQRGVIMFMRKLYDRSEMHLSAYARLLGSARPTAREARIAGTLLGSRYGVEDLLGGAGQIDWLGKLAMPHKIRTAMARQLPWRMRALTTRGRLRDAAGLLALGIQVFGSAAVAQSLSVRLFRSS